MIIQNFKNWKHAIASLFLVFFLIGIIFSCQREEEYTCECTDYYDGDYEYYYEYHKNYAAASSWCNDLESSYGYDYCYIY